MSALVTLLLLPAAALAHGGPRVLTSTEGRYHVAADERLIGFEGGSAVLDSTVYLEDAETGRPVTDARVRVTPPTRPPAGSARAWPTAGAPPTRRWCRCATPTSGATCASR